MTWRTFTLSCSWERLTLSSTPTQPWPGSTSWSSSSAASSTRWPTCCRWEPRRARWPTAWPSCPASPWPCRSFTRSSAAGDALVVSTQQQPIPWGTGRRPL
ncbi:hypothetical protein lerEdw1_020695, partial [Lerista edwardsae]